MLVCSECQKKCLITHECKCGKIFCINHRHIDHNCSYDYQVEGKKFLVSSMPKIDSIRMNKID